MSTSAPNSQYLLLFRNTDWSRELAPAEIQEIMGRTNAWFDRLATEGKAKGAQPLEMQGRTVSFKNGVISDGPFVESKESVGGYLLLEVAGFDEAMAIARENPMVPHGPARSRRGSPAGRRRVPFRQGGLGKSRPSPCLSG